MDYLWHCWSCNERNAPSGDAVVWANRAGSKTLLGAAATLLDCLFREGCSVRILAGSLDQSNRMYEYLVQLIHRGFSDMVHGKVLKERCEFVNGSSAAVLAQSARSVRGRHIHKLRCDEIELFDEDVFAAAKFVTKSSPKIKGAMEILSTMHRPGGIMSRVINQTLESGSAQVFKWCMWEVIERCTDRNCSTCPLWSDCGGKAKKARGYLSVDDCISQMRRSSRAGFEAEMLCMKPNLENAVFGDFDTNVHVAPTEINTANPLYRAIDFGFVNPFVCLFIQVGEDGVVRVVDEYVRRRAGIAEHVKEIKLRTDRREEQVAATYCDPAGAGRNDVTGTSAVSELTAMGIRVSYVRSRIMEGIELIRRALRSGDSKARLVISNKCTNLIEAMKNYHYPTDQASELPLKDGVYDHYIDALRYFFVNYEKKSPACGKVY